jgi:methylase of polypeptide subunit release factors
MAERSTSFGGLLIRYDEDVLEPRDWTLQQARWAEAGSARAPAGPVLELCAGAGQIGLVLARGTGRPLVQVDVDPRACALARANAREAAIGADVRCGQPGDVLGAGERFPIILADPPYIPSSDTALHPDDPRLAIDGGPDGLVVARQCLGVIGAHLAEGGFAVLQLRDLDQLEALGDGVRAGGLVVVGQLACEDRGALARLERAGPPPAAPS